MISKSPLQLQGKEVERGEKVAFALQPAACSRRELGAELEIPGVDENISGSRPVCLAQAKRLN